MQFNNTTGFPNIMVFVSAITALTTIATSKPTGPDIKSLYKQSGKMKITIGKNTFDAVLFENSTVVNFKKMLPLTLSMTELNGNEKYADLPTRVSTNPFNPSHIKAGDLMIYGSSTLVLFYKSFPTSYSYTPLGRIEDISGLEEAVGSGNVSVSFELK